MTDTPPAEKYDLCHECGGLCCCLYLANDEDAQEDLLVGDDPASAVYVGQKAKAAARVMLGVGAGLAAGIRADAARAGNGVAA